MEGWLADTRWFYVGTDCTSFDPRVMQTEGAQKYINLYRTIEERDYMTFV